VLNHCFRVLQSFLPYRGGGALAKTGRCEFAMADPVIAIRLYVLAFYSLRHEKREYIAHTVSTFCPNVPKISAATVSPLLARTHDWTHH
jgi:hypothetical protein